MELFSKKEYETMKKYQKGIITIVAFADDNSDLKQAFRNIFKEHQFTKMGIKTFYMSPSNVYFLRSLLDKCEGIDKEEVKLRVCGCESRRVTTVIGLVGSKSHLLLYPQTLDFNSDHSERDYNGKVRSRGNKIKTPSVSTGEVLGSALGYESDNTSEDTESSEVTGDEHREGDCLIDQIRLTFGNWLERLADGSLKRWTLSEWPEWT